jgi:hypothetical protein
MTSPDDLCVICLSHMEEDEKYTIDCQHTFHTKCIMEWFRRSNGNCPCCNHIPSISTNNPMVNYNFMSQIYIDSRFKALKKYSRKNGSPNNLKKEVENIKYLSNETQNVKKNITSIKKSEGWKNLKNLERDLAKKEEKIKKMKLDVVSNYPNIITY